jgi:Beta-lactamase
MPEAVKLTEKDRLDAALKLIHGVQLDEAMIRAHVMRPENVLGVSCDRGRDDQRVPAAIGGPPVVHPGYALDVRGFLDAIEAQLNDCVAGYAMRLNENGAPIATLEWGWAKEPQDGGEGWTTDTRQHVASLSKQPTAIAMTRLLSEKGLYPETGIIDYLPDYWVKGPNVEQITFARLLTHTSGLNYGAPAGGPSDYGSMKAAIAAGTTHLGEFWYQNMNFGLCRILISTINGNISPSVIWTGVLSLLNDTFWDLTTLSAYQTYVHANVFAPSGVTDPTLAHETNDALAYNFPVSGNGWNSGDLTTMAGGTGWHMTVDDVLKVMGTFRRAGTIMSPAQAQTMLEDSFGIDWITPTQLGTFYAKVGGWGAATAKFEQGVLFYLPQNMELVVLVNSPIGPPYPESLFAVVSYAYTSNIVLVPPIPR